MKTASAILRFCLLIEGFVLILRTPQVIAAALGAASAMGDVVSAYWASLADKLEYGLPVLGMCSLMTVWGMLTNRRWADRAALFLTVIHLFLLPFGFVVATAGIWFWRERRANGAALQMDVRWQEAVPTSMLPAAFRLLAAIAIAGLAALLFMLIRHSQVTPEHEMLPLGVPALLAVPAYIALQMLHDLASYAAGRVSGFEYEVIPLGPLQLVRTNRAGWAVRLRDRSIWRYLHLSCWPLRDDRLESRLFVQQLGGVLSDFAVGLVAFAAAATLPFPYVMEIAGLYSFVAFSRFLMDVSLSRTATEDFTPGARLVHIWNRTAEGERWIAMHSIGRSQVTPVRPAEWPESWVIRLTSDPESPCYPAGCYYAYAHYLDAENLVKAGEYLQLVRELSGWQRQERIVVELAFFEAFTGQDRIGFPDFTGNPNSERSIAALRMEAMSLLSEGYTIDAVSRLEQSRRSLDQQPRGGWVIFENNLLSRIEQKILDAKAPHKEPVHELEPALSALQFGQLIRRTAM